MVLKRRSRSVQNLNGKSTNATFMKIQRKTEVVKILNLPVPKILNTQVGEDFKLFMAGNDQVRM
jgi:hypothetical protein